MNKGNQKKTTEKYINYLVELIKKHNLLHLRSVNLKDKELLKKYFPNREDTLNQAFSYMIKSLKSIGVIEDADGQFIPNVKCRYYKINIEELMKHTSLDFNSDKEFIEHLFPFATRESRIEQLSSLSPSSSLVLSSSNGNKVEILKKIDEKGLIDLEPFRIRNSNISEEELYDVADYYGLKIRYGNPIYLECRRIID